MTNATTCVERAVLETPMHGGDLGGEAVMGWYHHGGNSQPTMQLGNPQHGWLGSG